MVKMEVVDIRQIIAKMMILDLMVISNAAMMPSCVADKGPMSNTCVPEYEKGRNNQRKMIRPFANISLMHTGLGLILEIKTNATERMMPGTNADTRVQTAIRMEKTDTASIFTLGSRLWIIDFEYV